MGPAYYVIAILGCADGSSSCTPVATVPTRFESETTCAAATADALMARSDLEFPTLVAQCQSMRLPIAAGSDARPTAIPAGALRG